MRTGKVSKDWCSRERLSNKHRRLCWKLMNSAMLLTATLGGFLLLTCAGTMLSTRDRGSAVINSEAVDLRMFDIVAVNVAKGTAVG